MSGWNVIIVTLGPHEVVGHDVRRRLAQAWSGPALGTLEVSSSAEVAEESIRRADAVVLVSDRSISQSEALSIFEVLEETGMPMLVLLDAPPEPDNFYAYFGALVECWNVADARLCALLHGLIHRQAEIKKLKSEAALSQRFHGGLKGQIAKMHEELQLAALVQREFLPREMPGMHGVEFAALWRPTNYVSGDIYDLIRLDEDHIGVFIADAVGHGVPAALMTMVICRSLVTKEITGNTYRLIEPDQVLARLNMEMIRRQGRTTRFATAIYAVVDCRRRTVKLAGAGHPPPVRLLENGSSQTLETRGGLLGVFPDETYDQIEIELAIGDRLLFYTDGFEQAFPDTAEDAHQRRVPTRQYRSEFDQLSRLPNAAAMIDAINQRLDDQAGSLHQIDDLTLICMHAGALSGRPSDAAEPPVHETETAVAEGHAERGPSLRLVP